MTELKKVKKQLEENQEKLEALAFVHRDLATEVLVEFDFVERPRDKRETDEPTRIMDIILAQTQPSEYVKGEKTYDVAVSYRELDGGPFTMTDELKGKATAAKYAGYDLADERRRLLKKQHALRALEDTE